MAKNFKAEQLIRAILCVCKSKHWLFGGYFKSHTGRFLPSFPKSSDQCISDEKYGKVAILRRKRLKIEFWALRSNFQSGPVLTPILQGWRLFESSGNRRFRVMEIHSGGKWRQDASRYVQCSWCSWCIKICSCIPNFVQPPKFCWRLNSIFSPSRSGCTDRKCLW